MNCDVMMRIGLWKKAASLENKSLLFQSSSRLRRGWYASVVKILTSNLRLKPLVPTLCLLLVVIYGLGDKLHNFVAGIFIPQYHYPYAVALCFGQVVISLLVLNLLHVLDLVPLRSYSRLLGERLLVPSICNSIYGVLAMWAKANSSYSGLLPFVMPLLPLLTMGLSFILKLASPLSVHVYVLISFLSGTSVVITVSHGVSNEEFLVYIYAPLALILCSVYLTSLAKVSEAERHHSPDAQVSMFDIYYAHLVNQSWVLGVLWLLHPDNPWHVLHQGSWLNLLFHGYLLAILLLGMALNFIIGMTVMCFSPLAAAALHSAYQLVLPFFPPNLVL